MQINLFRPKKREQWIAELREKGWHVRIMHQNHKVTPDIESIVIDTATNHWKTFVKTFEKRGVQLFLLVDEGTSFQNEEQEEWGISGILYPHREFSPRLFNPQREDKVGDVDQGEHHPVQLQNPAVPLSQRIKKTDPPVESEQTDIETAHESSPVQERPDSELKVEAREEMNTVSSVKENGSQSPPSIVTVYGAKGGVGKTVFMLNLAALLARYQIKVCILDLDIYHGTVGSTQHVHPDLTITDLVRRMDDPNEREACLLQSEMGFSFVAAPTEYMDISGISVESITALLKVLRQDFEVILIDTSLFFDELTKLAIKHSDQVILMTTDEPASVKNLRRMKKELSSPDSEAQVVWVRNRVTGNGVALEEMTEFLPWPYLFGLQEDPNVDDAAKGGQWISISQPSHPYSVQLDELVRGWIGLDPAYRKTWKQQIEVTLQRLRKKKGEE